MRLLRPRSLNGRLILGLAVLVAPLLAGLVTAVVELRRLSDSSGRLVVEGVRATRLAQQLYNQTGALERRARYYQVLRDDNLLEAYRTESSRAVSVERDLESNLRSAAAQASLWRYAALREDLAARIEMAPRGDAGLEGILADFARLDRLASDLSRQANEQIDAELDALRSGTRRAQQRLFWEVALLLPLTALAVLAFSLGLGRPLRKIDKVIDELGRGPVREPIRIDGPVDLERLGHQLEWLRSRLLDVAEERNRFLRHMSHELKTPLANIREGTELLMDGAVGHMTPEQHEVTGILRENSLNLQRLIENLLSYSAWQSSNTGLESSRFRLRQIALQVIKNQQLALLGRRVNLDVKLEDIELTADRAKLRLILENLLSNAIKYSPAGGTIRLAARARGTELILDISDSGPGIPPEERGHVFDAFFTGRAPKGHVRGTGIGLSVVLEFVTAHGGSIEIVDGESRGAHFRIRMPLHHDPAQT
ncbi:MAG: hypothetical protein RLZZ200_2251 [Pseudomonadota bacterium]|jgi:two-component system sensor histidine kinase GlrK